MQYTTYHGPSKHLRTWEPTDPRLISCTAGFSLIELMITVVVAGLLTGVSLANLNGRWQNERLQTISKTLVSWLEERRRVAMTGEKAQELGTGVCTISFDAPAATFSAPASPSGSPPNICSISNPLKLRQVTTNASSLTLTAVGGTVSPVLFSFRGTSPTSPESTASSPPPTEFKLQLENQAAARCVLITRPLGLIRQGIAKPASSQCSYNFLMYRF